jgi:hypothetical protein
MQTRRFLALIGIFAIVFAAKFASDLMERVNPIPTKEEQAILDRANKASEAAQKDAVAQNLRPTPAAGNRLQPGQAGRAVDSSGRAILIERIESSSGCKLVIRIANEAITPEEITSASVAGRSVSVERFPGSNDAAIACGLPGSEVRFTRRTRRGTESEFVLQKS